MASNHREVEAIRQSKNHLPSRLNREDSLKVRVVSKNYVNADVHRQIWYMSQLRRNRSNNNAFNSNRTRNGEMECQLQRYQHLRGNDRNRNRKSRSIANSYIVFLVVRVRWPLI